ncbi:MAG: serine peptidase [Gammaproteobacteria bacterium]|nr:MAG: serine peptidase [Gammaproteobacteria bacterium]
MIRKRAFLTATLLMFLAGSNLVNAAELPDFATLADNAGPSVVNISTKQERKRGPMRGRGIPQAPPGTPLDDFFQHFFGEQGGRDGSIAPARSLGSGFIISADGYLLTNHHVVADADEIIVRLSDRREFVAELIGSDARSDIAVLKIDAKNLKALKIGNPSDLRVGEWVAAIGSPFGFEHSVTAGIVSAKGRSLPSDSYVPFIQTDVAINPGNSGGPLFNMDGEVVGVNSQIYSGTGGFMGLSFAIPIDVAMRVSNQLRDKGFVVRGWLGVLIQDVTRGLAESFGMDQPRGALVAKVLPDSPAEKAGLQVGDIVVSYDGEEIIYSADLPPLVGGGDVGHKARLSVLRGGKEQVIRVTIEELPEDHGNAAPIKTKQKNDDRLGLIVAELSAAQRDSMEIDDVGVLVQQVAEGAAAEAGIRRGDVIVSVDNQSTSSVKAFRKHVAALKPGAVVPVLIQRRQGPVFLAIRVPEASG